MKMIKIQSVACTGTLTLVNVSFGRYNVSEHYPFDETPQELFLTGTW